MVIFYSKRAKYTYQHYMKELQILTYQSGPQKKKTFWKDAADD